MNINEFVLHIVMRKYDYFLAFYKNSKGIKSECVFKRDLYNLKNRSTGADPDPKNGRGLLGIF